MFEEVQGKEGGKKASVSDSRYYGLLNEKKKRLAQIITGGGKKRDNILRSWTATRGEEHV